MNESKVKENILCLEPHVFKSILFKQYKKDPTHCSNHSTDSPEATERYLSLSTVIGETVTMLSLCFLMSLLFRLQLGETGANERLKELCSHTICPIPDRVISYGSYEETQYQADNWVTTRVWGSDMLRAIVTGRNRLLEYAAGANDAGIIVPVSAPLVLNRTTNQDNVEQNFTVFLFIPSFVVNPPQPTDDRVKLLTKADFTVYVRFFNQLESVAELDRKAAKFLSDLEAENQPILKQFFAVGWYNNKGFKGIFFFKTKN